MLYAFGFKRENFIQAVYYQSLNNLLNRAKYNPNVCYQTHDQDYIDVDDRRPL